MSEKTHQRFQGLIMKYFDVLFVHVDTQTDAWGRYVVMSCQAPSWVNALAWAGGIAMKRSPFIYEGRLVRLHVVGAAGVGNYELLDGVIAKGLIDDCPF